MSHITTRRRAIHNSLLFLFVLLLLTKASSVSDACATASPLESRIEIAQEYAVIVWDAATHTEHFIRNATFHTDARDFGFLVPTPSIPTLAIEDDGLFYQLDTLLLPKHERQTKTVYNFNPLWLGRKDVAEKTATFSLATAAGATRAMSMEKSASVVRVLDSRKLGTYDTVVLEADNALALNHWLAAHGYASRPALTAWLEPYITAHWKITAFKIAASPNVSEDAYRWGLVDMPPIRMSFHAERPFYPYREPAQEPKAPHGSAPRARNADTLSRLPDAPETNTSSWLANAQSKSATLTSASRLLRVYMLGSERMQGAFGGTKQALSWPGRVTWTDHLPIQAQNSLTNEINAPAYDSEGDPIKAPKSHVSLPANTCLTVFEDRSSPRPGIEDVFFDRSNDQSAITPPPIIDYDYHTVAIPADVIALPLIGIVGAGFFVRRLRASRRSNIRARTA